MSELPPLDAATGGAFSAVLGFDLDEVGGSRVTGTLDVGEEHHTPWGVVHGGVWCSVVEAAASIGASAAVAGRGQFSVGVNNSTDFLRPVTAGRIEVLAEAVQQGRTLQLWQVTITRADDGKIVARGQVRLQNVPLPAS